jgi:hypothetical protein
MSANSRRLEVAVGRRLAHSLARMMRLHPHLRSPVSPRRAGVALIAALVAAWPAASAPELSATGAAIATGSDLLETSIVVEKLVPAARPAGGSGRFVAAERLDAGEVAYYTVSGTRGRRPYPTCRSPSACRMACSTSRDRRWVPLPTCSPRPTEARRSLPVLRAPNTRTCAGSCASRSHQAPLRCCASVRLSADRGQRAR